VHDREDRGVCPDANRQRDDGHRGKQGLTTAPAQRVAAITHDFFEQCHTPDLAVRLA